MGSKVRRRRAKRVDPVTRYVRPTEAREAHNDFRSAGSAVRVVPPIETLYSAGKLTELEFLALDYYREQAHKAEDDLAQTSPIHPEKAMGGGGSPGGRLPAIFLATPAILETGRIERDLGSLLDIAQAIARDDLTLAAWCIEKHGGRERLNGAGQFIAMVPVAEKRVTAIALLELKMAAHRIVR